MTELCTAIRILGPVDHLRSGLPTPVRGKPAAVLTTLALHANRPVTLDLLTEVLWDGEPPRSAVANLRTYVCSLREVLEGCRATVDADSGGYVLCVPVQECDYLRFEELVTLGGAAMAQRAPLEAAAMLERALDLWRGDAAALGVPRRGPLAVWLDCLDEEYMRTVECLAEARIALGEARLAARELSALLARSPLRERAWWLRMHAHYKLGEYDSVVASYQASAKLFRTELGLAPSPELTGLYRLLVGKGKEPVRLG